MIQCFVILVVWFTKKCWIISPPPPCPLPPQQQHNGYCQARLLNCFWRPADIRHKSYSGLKLSTHWTDELSLRKTSSFHSLLWQMEAWYSSLNGETIDNDVNYYVLMTAKHDVTVQSQWWIGALLISVFTESWGFVIHNVRTVKRIYWWMPAAIFQTRQHTWRRKHTLQIWRMLLSLPSACFVFIRCNALSCVF